MFKNNKWLVIYMAIINKAILRIQPEGYKEKHHIIPKSMGGNNHSLNLVFLTAREHLIVHKLLVRFTEGNERKKAIAGLWAMAVLRKDSNRIIMSSRQFANLRVKYFESRKNVSPSIKTKEKISASLKGRKIPEEVIKKRSITYSVNAKNGKHLKRSALTKEKKQIRNNKMKDYFTKEERRIISSKAILTKKQWSTDKQKEYSQKLSLSNTSKKRNQEQKMNISCGQKGHKVSQETRNKISKFNTGKIKEPTIQFTLLMPDGSVYVKIGKAKEIAEFIGTGVKYLYLSLKNNMPISKGKAKGWKLLSKIKFTHR